MSTASQFEGSTVVIIAIVCVLIVLFLTCIGVSVFLCLQIHVDNRRFLISGRTSRVSSQVHVDQQEEDHKRQEKLKENLDKQFKESAKKYARIRDNTRPHSRAATNRDNPCAVCLEKYEHVNTCQEKIGLLTQCGHFYHFDCIWPWLRRQESCPVCRKDTHIQEDSIKAVCFAEILTDKSLTVIKHTTVEVPDEVPSKSESPISWFDPAHDLPGSVPHDAQVEHIAMGDV